MITDSDIYALQAHAIATSDMHLRATTYTALGYSSRYAFEPATRGEVTKARQACADAIEMMALMGAPLRGRSDALEAA